MKYTLLELTQDILSALDSEEVNGINDTAESTQVAHIIKHVYDEMLVELEPPSEETLIKLTHTGDSTKPCVMSVPDGVANIHKIFYDCRLESADKPLWIELEYVCFDEFLARQAQFRELLSTQMGEQTITENSNTFSFLYLKDRAPSYWTTMNDDTLLFDAYDNTLENTLQQSKTLCIGCKYPTLTMSDNAYPEIADQYFPMLFNKAKARAFLELKQTTNAEATSTARQQKITLQRRKRVTPDNPEVTKHQRYGRK